MITTKDLKYTYKGGPQLVFPDISCRASDILLILGNSGVGKTTLLHLLGGILTTHEGSVNIEGTNICTLGDTALDAFRGKNIGIVFQQNHFIDSLTVLENVMIAQKLAGNRVSAQEALAMLEKLNIGHKSKKSIRDLSQGEKQRVAIARALINKPKLILADEPTSALDDQNCQEVLLLLEDQAKAAGSALVVVTHDSRLKEKISNKVILVS